MDNIVSLIEKQWKLILGVLAAALVVAGAMVLMNAGATRKEKAAQESYFTVEKQLLDLKNKKPEDKSKTDYTAVKAGFEKVIADYPGSVASQMAGLHVAALLVEENNSAGALALLQKVETKDKGMVNTLVQQQIGQLLADQDKCPEAIGVWQKIVDRKEASFLHNETKIQQALCYTKTNDLKKAEEILTNIANQNTGSDAGTSAASKEAEKYLRLIQFKKASGT